MVAITSSWLSEIASRKKISQIQYLAFAIASHVDANQKLVLLIKLKILTRYHPKAHWEKWYLNAVNILKWISGLLSSLTLSHYDLVIQLGTEGAFILWQIDGIQSWVWLWHEMCGCACMTMRHCKTIFSVTETEGPIHYSRDSFRSFSLRYVYRM